MNRPRRPLRPDTSTWRFADEEERLFAARKSLHWRFSNQVRRNLAALLDEFLPRLAHTTELETDALAPKEKQQHAAILLGALGVRSLGALMALVACGYEREGFMASRSVLEAVLRCTQIAEDHSGAAADRYLRGRPTPGLKSLAQKQYDGQKLVAILDTFAHADLGSLAALEHESARKAREDRGENGRYLELRPARGFADPGGQLDFAALGCAGIICHLGDLFGEEIAMTPFLAQQMKRMG